MTIEAIAVDIDGTITDDERKICISAIEALRKAEEAGLPTIIVTGNVVNYAYATEVLIGCSGGLVAENGGIVFKEGENNNAVETMVERDFVTSAEKHLKEKADSKAVSARDGFSFFRKYKFDLFDFENQDNFAKSNYKAMLEKHNRQLYKNDLVL